MMVTYFQEMCHVLFLHSPLFSLCMMICKQVFIHLNIKLRELVQFYNATLIHNRALSIFCAEYNIMNDNIS